MDLSTFSRALVLLMVFVLVVLVAMLAINAVASRQIVRRRVAEQIESADQGSAGSLRSSHNETAWVKLVNLLEKRGLSLADTKDESLREKLRAAGYGHPAAPRIFTFIRLVLTLALPATYLIGSQLFGQAPGLLRLYLISAALAVAGLYLPNLFITAKADRRREAITNGFPDALDLMLVCVEAGLGLEATFDRVGREMVTAHPLIAEMLGTVVLELRAGQSREEALRRMAERVSIDEIKSFATLMIQSGKLGSSVAQTLRVYAAEMREKRQLRAEEKAHRLPVLLSLPLVGCLLPVMIGILMLPAVIRIMRQLLPAMGG